MRCKNLVSLSRNMMRPAVGIIINRPKIIIPGAEKSILVIFVSMFIGLVVIVIGISIPA